MLHAILRRLGQALARYLSRPHARLQTGVPTDSEALAQALRPGDVLLVEGNSRISGAIKYLTRSTWSHAALFVGPTLGGADASGLPHVFIEADMLEGVCSAACRTTSTTRRAFAARWA